MFQSEAGESGSPFYLCSYLHRLETSDKSGPEVDLTHALLEVTQSWLRVRILHQDIKQLTHPKMQSYIIMWQAIIIYVDDSHRYKMNINKSKYAEVEHPKIFLH